MGSRLSAQDCVTVHKTRVAAAVAVHRDSDTCHLLDVITQLIGRQQPCLSEDPWQKATEGRRDRRPEIENARLRIQAPFTRLVKFLQGVFDKETVAGHKGSLNEERAYVPVFDTMCHSDDTPVVVHTFDGNDASIAPIMIRPDKHFTFSGFGPAVSEGSLFAGEYGRASVTIPGASPAGLTRRRTFEAVSPAETGSYLVYSAQGFQMPPTPAWSFPATTITFVSPGLMTSVTSISKEDFQLLGLRCQR